MSADLVAFIRARLDEDDRRADRTHDEDCAYVHDIHTQNSDVPCDCPVPARLRRHLEIVARRIANFESAAEWEAGQIMDNLRLDATEWSDHPDYRAEWTP